MSSVHIRVLARAAELLGGTAKLRMWLGVSAKDLDAWMGGTKEPPDSVFLQAVDVITSRTTAQMSEAVRRSKETRSAARSVASAARGVQQRAADAIERSAELRARLLERQAPVAAGRNKTSAAEFAAAEFAPSEAPRMLEAALNAAVNGTSAARGNVQLAHPSGLRIVAHLGFDDRFLQYFALVDHRIPSACARAHLHAHRIVVGDVRTDPVFVGTRACEVMERAGARACQSTPLVSSSGEVLGVLSTHYEKPHQPSSRELETIDLIARHASFWLDGGAATPR